MQDWIIYGILASLFWGSFIVSTKVATDEKYFGINSNYVPIFMLVGIGAVFIGSLVHSGNFAMPASRLGIGFAIFAGVLWGLGMIVSIKAIAIGAPVAKLTPIYNTNTLVAVFLGAVLLHELPSSAAMIKVIIGSILIVIGAVLVSS